MIFFFLQFDALIIQQVDYKSAWGTAGQGGLLLLEVTGSVKDIYLIITLQVCVG